MGRFAENRKTFLLFLPEAEKHSLGLLFANYIIRARGHQVLYLGQEVPLLDLRDAFGREKPDYILTMMTAAQLDIDKQAFVDFLSVTWQNSKILLTGPQFINCEISLNENVSKISSLANFIDFINELSSVREKS